MTRPAVLDPSALRRARRQLASADPVMARLVAALGPTPMEFRRRGVSAFYYLARAIVGQQISVAAARSIANRLTARFGWPWRPEHVLAASEADLRALGLSRPKAAYLRDLAERTRDGLERALGHAEVIGTDDESDLLGVAGRWNQRAAHGEHDRDRASRNPRWPHRDLRSRREPAARQPFFGRSTLRHR